MKKLLILLLTTILIFTICGCSVVSSNGSNSKTYESNGISTVVSSSLLNKNSSNSSNSIISSSSIKSSVHIHTFNKAIETTDTLAKAATIYTPAEYYYSCDCGAKSTETFSTEPLDYKLNEVESYINYLIEEGSYENPLWNTENSSSATWNYIDGCMMTSFLKLYDLTKDDKYKTFVTTYLDYVVKSDGSMRGYSYSDYNLDNINEGRVLFDLYGYTDKAKYKTAIEKLYSQLENQPRANNCFWHKERYTNQVWLDGIYMAQPFYAKYQLTYGNGDLSDIMYQISQVEKNMKDKNTGIYYHGIDYGSSKASWADKTTGLSKSYWLRAMGWYYAALSDLTSILDKNSAEWKTIQGYLKNAVDSVLPYLDDEKYMFYQVVDKGNTKDSNDKSNYLETSGSALISYAILNGVNSGALDKSYRSIGKAIFNGICKEYLTVDGTTFTLGGICKVAGLSSDRNGTFEYYLSESIVKNEAKGVAPFLMAYVEIQKGRE